MARKTKKTLNVKRQMYGDTYNPENDSNYAKKKRLQAHGTYSETSPLRGNAKTTYNPYTNRPF